MQQFSTPGFYVELIIEHQRMAWVYGFLRNITKKKTIKHAPAAD
jgi:hypothetical protein